MNHGNGRDGNGSGAGRRAGRLVERGPGPGGLIIAGREATAGGGLILPGSGVGSSGLVTGPEVRQTWVCITRGDDSKLVVEQKRLLLAASILRRALLYELKLGEEVLVPDLDTDGCVQIAGGVPTKVLKGVVWRLDEQTGTIIKTGFTGSERELRARLALLNTNLQATGVLGTRLGCCMTFGADGQRIG